MHNVTDNYSNAVKNWIDGNDMLAITQLACCNSPHAQNLLRLIEQPYIHVLAQLPRITNGSQDLLFGAELDQKFKVKNIGFGQHDFQNRPYANIHDFYEADCPPDFYITQMVEWNLIPPNIQELPCPIFGQTSDYDLHIQSLYPWLSLFDELIVNGPNEMDEVGRLSGVPITAYRKTFNISDALPPLPPPGLRECDLFVSGTTMHPYHPDKARIFNRILDIPDVNMLFCNCFLLRNAYYEMLGHSKMALTFIRHADAMPTRGLESLAMGCALIVQKQSVLTHYLGEEEGVVTYDNQKDDLLDVITWIKREWPLFEQRARRGAEFVRREFGAARVASQYLRFLTVLAAKPRPLRQVRSVDSLTQKRSIQSRGWGFPQDIYTDLINENKRRSTEKENTGLRESPSEINDRVRDNMLDYYTWAWNATDSEYQYHRDQLSEIMLDFRQGTASFPRSLILHFNMIRAALHFGSPGDVQEALVRAEIVVGKMESYWHLLPLDDVMPWDFFSQMFNYRSYFDLITGHLKGSLQLTNQHVKLVLASLNYYLGNYTDHLAFLERAVELDPEFPFYRYRLALELLIRGEEGNCNRSGTLLESLVEDSILFAYAYPLLEKMVLEQGFQSKRFPCFRERFQRATDYLFTSNEMIEDWLINRYLRPDPTHDGNESGMYPRSLRQLAEEAIHLIQKKRVMH